MSTSLRQTRAFDFVYFSHYQSGNALLLRSALCRHIARVKEMMMSRERGRRPGAEVCLETQVSRRVVYEKTKNLFVRNIAQLGGKTGLTV